MHINHLTLTTGHLSRIKHGDVSDEMVAHMAPWLETLVASGPYASDVSAPLPLPAPALADYTAASTVENGLLLVTIFGPNPPGCLDKDQVPLVTMGVAKYPHHGPVLWSLLMETASPGNPVKRGLHRPAEPWCAVTLHPTLALHPLATKWLGDLERCIAWTWIIRVIPTVSERVPPSFGSCV